MSKARNIPAISSLGRPRQRVLGTRWPVNLTKSVDPRFGERLSQKLEWGLIEDKNLTPASGLCMHTCAYMCEPTQVNTYRPHPHRNILRARCPWSVFRSICQGTAEIFVTQILRMLLVSDNLKLLRCKCCLKVLIGGQ